MATGLKKGWREETGGAPDIQTEGKGRSEGREIGGEMEGWLRLKEKEISSRIGRKRRSWNTSTQKNRKKEAGRGGREE